MNLNYGINLTNMITHFNLSNSHFRNQSRTKPHSRGAEPAVQLEQGCSSSKGCRLRSSAGTRQQLCKGKRCKRFTAIALLPLKLNSTNVRRGKFSNRKLEAPGPLKDKLPERLQYRVLLIIKDSRTIGVFDNDHWENANG